MHDSNDTNLEYINSTRKYNRLVFVLLIESAGKVTPHLFRDVQKNM